MDDKRVEILDAAEASVSPVVGVVDGEDDMDVEVVAPEAVVLVVDAEPDGLLELHALSIKPVIAMTATDDRRRLTAKRLEIGAIGYLLSI